MEQTKILSHTQNLVQLDKE